MVHHLRFELRTPRVSDECSNQTELIVHVVNIIVIEVKKNNKRGQLAPDFLDYSATTVYLVSIFSPRASLLLDTNPFGANELNVALTL